MARESTDTSMPEHEPHNELRRAELLAEGKTKQIYAIEGDARHCIVAYKNTITAFDDPSFTKEFATKAKYSNMTTCRVFEMLARAGIPTAYVRQLNDTEFLAERCAMIPLEVVARRFAFGSYLKRYSEYAVPEGAMGTIAPSASPPRFEQPVVEFFRKKTKGGLKDAHGEVLVE